MRTFGDFDSNIINIGKEIVYILAQFKPTYVHIIYFLDFAMQLTIIYLSIVN